MKHGAATLALACVLGCAGTQPRPGRLADVGAPAPGSAHVSRVLFENELVRMLELQLAPGQSVSPRVATASHVLAGGARALVVERKADPPPFVGEYLDAPTLAPDEYRVVDENDAFRVIEIRRAPGKESVPHSHRAGVAYALESARVSQTVPGEAPVERTLELGAAAPIPVIALHTEKNVGTTPVHVVLFELK